VICPECGVATLQYRDRESVEPHGEVWRQQWWECPACHEKFTEEDLERESRRSA
jgi:transcriptional regulator NrdR family protein